MSHFEKGTQVDAILQEGSRLGCALTPRVAERLALFMELIGRWNPRVRLVGRGDFESLLFGHLPDAFVLTRVLTEGMRKGAKVEFPLLDVGSGAGLPGFALALLLPEASFCLCDSAQKKISFLLEAERQLQTGVSLVHSTAEDLVAKGKRFPQVVSRAVFRPVHWQRLGAALCGPQGLVWNLWTRKQEMEMAGTQVDFRHPYKLLDGRERVLTSFAAPAKEDCFT